MKRSRDLPQKYQILFLERLADLVKAFFETFSGIFHCICRFFNTFSGGFTGIFVCIILVPVLEKYAKTKEQRKAAKVG